MSYILALALVALVHAVIRWADAERRLRAREAVLWRSAQRRAELHTRAIRAEEVLDRALASLATATGTSIDYQRHVHGLDQDA